MKKQINFSTKNAKALRISANLEGKGMNHAIKAVASVWNGKTTDKELTASIEAAKADGLTLDDFSADFIKAHLEGTNFCKGGVIGVTSKGEFTAKATWTAGQIVDYVRRANRAKILKANKAEESK